MASGSALFLLGESPYPVNSGSLMRTHVFIEAARAAGLEVSLIYLADGRSIPPAQWPDRNFKQVWPVFADSSCAQPRNLAGRVAAKWREVVQFAKGRPWGYSDGETTEFTQQFLDVIRSNTFDVVFCRYISLAQFALLHRAELHSKVIVDLDDIEPIKAARQLALMRRRWSYGYWRTWLNNWLLARFHQRLSAADICLVCSQSDRHYVLAKGWSTDVRVIANAVNVASDACIDMYSKQAWLQQRLLFCGNLSYGPNLDGLRWFLECVWPLVRAAAPDATLCIVGKNPDPLLLPYVDGKYVSLYANVPDVLDYYLNSAVSIAPILAAGGTRIKILEAFANHRPVVSTSVGAEGLNVQHGDHCLIADSPEQFAQACCELLGSWEKALALTLQAHRLVLAEYDSTAIKAQIKRLFG